MKRENNGKTRGNGENKGNLGEEVKNKREELWQGEEPVGRTRREGKKGK